MLNFEQKEKIKNILNTGGVIAFVTDTVWGIGCLADNEKAVKKIYQIKGREKEKPLILMSDDIYPLFDYVKDIPKSAHRLIKNFFPGALTVVLPKSTKTPDYITSNLSTVGIRVPNNEIFSQICKCIPTRVLATTSANLSHNPPALTFDEAVKVIGNYVDLVINDYGYTAKGTASTVVGFDGETPVIYRQGDILINVTT